MSKITRRPSHPVSKQAHPKHASHTKGKEKLVPSGLVEPKGFRFGPDRNTDSFQSVFEVPAGFQMGSVPSDEK